MTSESNNAVLAILDDSEGAPLEKTPSMQEALLGGVLPPDEVSEPTPKRKKAKDSQLENFRKSMSGLPLEWETLKNTTKTWVLNLKVAVEKIPGTNYNHSDAGRGEATLYNTEFICSGLDDGGGFEDRATHHRGVGAGAWFGESGEESHRTPGFRRCLDLSANGHADKIQVSGCGLEC